MNFSNLSHYTCVDAFKNIIESMTLKFTSIESENLNDLQEKERKGIESIAKSIYTSCFTKREEESVPFWSLYGNNNKKKILMKFGDVSGETTDFFDSSLAENECGEYLLINITEYKDKKRIAQNDIVGIIDNLKMIDVEYVGHQSEKLIGNYEKDILLDSGNNIFYVPDIKDASCLGRYKNVAWDFEEEKRVLLRVTSGKNIGSSIYVHIKPLFFKDMTIVLSPWDEGDLLGEVERIINESQLPVEIKKSMKIKDSEIKGTINFKR